MQNTTDTRRRCKVLVLEDDSGDLFLLERALQTAAKAAGVAVELMRSVNGLEGLSAIALGDLTLRLPNVVVVDLNMPIMGGELFLRRLRVDLELRQVPAVVLTTSNQKHDHAAVRALGADDVFAKPSSFSELVAIAGKIIELAMQEVAPKEAQRIARRGR